MSAASHWATVIGSLSRVSYVGNRRIPPAIASPDPVCHGVDAVDPGALPGDDVLLLRYGKDI